MEGVMPTAAQRFAQFALELELDAVPDEVVEAAKLHVLDVIGCGLAAHGLGIAGEGRATMSELGGEAESAVIGLDARLPVPNAAFANAMLCHGLDFDDTHSDSVSHVSTVVVPAAAALAEARGASGRELLTAIIAGNETVTRIGMATPGAFHKRGFHPTAICGIFGATAAAARLGELGASGAASALGIAGSMASGLFAYLDDATATKPIHPAWAAHGALLATRLAAHGAEGPPGVLEGRFGVFHAFVNTRIDLEPQLADLGSRWETLRISFKAFPACHFIHGSLGATETLREGLDPNEIEDVVVTVPEAGVSLVLEPAESKVAPRSDYEGKFSLQFSTAAMLVHGRVGLTTYTPQVLTDARVLELARKVRYETKEYA
jgi:2-methylcitrate dehydratase PrpD